MVSLHAWMLCAATFGAGETVLLEFSAPWCGPCQSMAPTVQRLTADGYPVRPIDVDRDRQLAAQYGVTAVPCFVMLVDGRPVSRLEGAVSHAALVDMFDKARVAPAGPKRDPVQGRPPDSSSSPSDRQEGPPRETGLNRDDRLQPVRFEPAPGTDPPAAAPGPENPRADSEAAVERARLATVRLKIEDDRGHSFGTGTIIDTHGDEALVLTCGHIFRDSGGRGPIHVDLFASGAACSVEGQVIHYDLQRDIGLVSIRPRTPIVPIPVAPGGHRIRCGDRVFTIGCDRGGEPTVRASQITAIDKYLGSPNVEVAGQPVDGRSGGGLFSADGYLIGICNAADPADDEGIYAALSTVHQQLDLIGQRRIYDSGTSPPASAERASTQPAPPRLAEDRSSQPSAPTPADLGADGRSGPDPQAAPIAAAAEVICIIRSKNDPLGGNRLVVLEQPSAELLQQLDRESRGQLAAALAERQTGGAAANSPPARNAATNPAPVVRGQSMD